MHGQNDDPDLGELGFDDPGGINTIHDGHAYIHQHYVWSVLFYGLNGSQSIPCLRNDLEVALFLKKVGDGISVMQVVVNDDDSERCSWHRDNLQNTGPEKLLLTGNLIWHQWGGSCI